jgi:POT family proton-dependent oligopeptide transporter
VSQEHTGEQPFRNEEKMEHPALSSSLAQDAALERIHNFEGQYPKQLWLLFLTEMWERFCFYGMRGILTIFIGTEILNHLPESVADQTANLQYGAIQAFVYAFTFVGGLFADKILGFRKSLFWGGILMIAGNFLIAANPHKFFYIGICFTIIGTGFFKPNISTMVGALYREGDPRRDAGFGLFYSGINIGAFLGGIVCVYIGKELGSWSGAFAAAGTVMVIGLVTFLFTQRTLGPIGLSPLPEAMPMSKKRLREILVYAGSLAAIPLILLMVTNTRYTDIFMYVVGPATLVYLFFEMRRFGKKERQKLIAALVFIIFSILFWGIYEQAGGSLAIFALKNLKPNLLGFHIDPNIVNNSSNAIFVIALSPLVGLAWVMLAKKKANPNTVVKFGLGFLFVAAAYFLYYYLRDFANAEGFTSLNVFTLAYLVITFGELCLSPIGLSIMTKLSPKPLWGVMMGMWFLASAYGQYVAGRIGAGLADVPESASNLDRLMAYTEGYKQLAIYALIAGVVLIAISPFVRKLMHEVK